MKTKFGGIIALMLLTSLGVSAQLGVEIGMDMHVAGGGPTVGISWQQKGMRLGANVLTQINAFTPYKFEPYGDYRFADNAKQMFGGGISLGYVFKSQTTQKVKPLLIYRGGYFYTRYGKSQGNLSPGGQESLIFLYSVDKGFSTTQTVSAGITAELGKNFVLDATLGGGAYIFRNRADFSSLRNPNFESPFSASTYIRPDFNLNVTVAYRFSLAKK